MNKEKILSPWRSNEYQDYTMYYRISMMNVIRAECIRPKPERPNYGFWSRINDKDRLLIKDGYILCSEEQWDKYQMLV